MAISEACKFEIKEEVDCMLENGDASTKSDAFKAMVNFYKTIGIEVKENTIRSKYHRAKKVANATIDSTNSNNTKNSQLEKLEKNTHGGARNGSGRKPKQEIEMEKEGVEYNNRRKKLTKEENEAGLLRASDAETFATMAITNLERIRKDDPLKKQALERVIKWIQKQ